MSRRPRILARAHAAELNARTRHDAPAIMAQALTETTTRCAACGWVFVGSEDDGRRRFMEHRAAAHQG